MTSSTRHPVLIETLWNVNLDYTEYLYIVLKRINRNIVECKLETMYTSTIVTYLY